MSTFNSKADRAAYIFFFLLGPSAKFHPLKLTNGLIGVYNVPHRFMFLNTRSLVGSLGVRGSLAGGSESLRSEASD